MTRFFLGRALETSRLAHRVLVSRRSIGTKYHRKIESNHPSSYVEASKSTAIYTYMSDVVLDSGVLSSCKKLNLSLPTELRGLRVKWKSNPRKLGATFSPNHCLNRTAMKYLDRYEHPFRKSILEIYFAKHKAPLWYNAWVGGALVSPFPSSRARKKIEHALRDALAAYGYDRDGRKLKTEEPSAVAELYGTLNIGCQDPLAVCNSKFADLLEDAKVIIGRAVEELSRDKYGRPLRPGGSGQPPRKSFNPNKVRENPGSLPGKGHYSSTRGPERVRSGVEPGRPLRRVY